MREELAPKILDCQSGMGYARSLVASPNGHDRIDIQLEGDLDLWNTFWSWRDTLELKLTEQMVVLGQAPLPFVYLDDHSLLIV
jgi:hypothetical protein